MRFETSTKRRLAIFSVVLMAMALPGCMRTPEEKSAAFVQAGKRLLEKKDPARAILQFRNAIQATPRNAEAYYQLSLAYLAAADYGQGVGALRKSLELNPKHAGAQLRLAQLMADGSDKGLLQDAQQRLQTLLQDAPENPDALHALALTEFKLGDWGGAMQHLQLAASAAPQELRIAITLAQAKLQQKDPRGAEDVLKRFSDASPRSAEAHGVLGEYYISQKRMPEAEVQMRKALEIDPKSGPALMTLARLQLTDGRKAEAEQNFKKLAGFNGYESIYAIYLDQEGRRDESLREFEKLAKAHPEDRQARTNLVAAYQNLNRSSDAEKILDQAIKKNSKDLDALLQRGELFLAAGKYDQAQEDLNQVLHVQPASAAAHYVLAKLHRARGEDLSYRESLAKALELNPYLVNVRLELAQAMVVGNGAKVALDLLDKTPESQKQMTQVLVLRNWTFWALGDLQQMRIGIDLGLSRERSADFLLQDGLWKLRTANFTGARSALEEALKINPADVRALGALTRSYEVQKQGPVGLEKVKEYASRQPKSAPVQEFLGLTLLAHGDRKQARTAFMAARAADPQFVRADLSLVQLDALEGKWDDGASRLNIILAKDSRNPLANLWLGEIDTVKGNQSSALDHFRKALDGSPDDAQSLNNLAYVLADYSKQTDLALKYAARAQELAPENPDYADTMGWILYQKGLYPSAIKHLERAASKEGNVAWKYHLAMAYAKAGDGKRARATLEVALKRDPNTSEAKMARKLLEETK